jgi:hypothetical protein
MSKAILAIRTMCAVPNGSWPDSFWLSALGV